MAAPAGAIVTFPVQDDAVTCDTVSGTIAFVTYHLTLSGPTTGANSIKIVLALSGCSDDNDPVVGGQHVKVFKGATTITLTTNNGWNCTGLFANNIGAMGSSQIVWTPGSGQGFTPKTTVGTVQKSATDLTIAETNGGIYAVDASVAPWAGSYGYFSMGAPFGTAAMGGTVDFTGGEAGTGSWLAATTREGVGNLATQCSATAGLAKANFGIGTVHIG